MVAQRYCSHSRENLQKFPGMSPVESDEQDLTRKQRREQARSDRKAMEEAAAASAMRRTRLTQLGGVVAVVVIAIVVILVATGGSSKKGIPASKHEQSSVANEVSSLVGAIPQNGRVLGSPTAPVSLQYFGDLECPICQKFTLGALPSVIHDLGQHRQAAHRIPRVADGHA